MTNESALLAAILADPADDAPRLIFADWLDEQGHGDRAEFIRVQVQVELARLPDPPALPTITPTEISIDPNRFTCLVDAEQLRQAGVKVGTTVALALPDSHLIPAATVDAITTDISIHGVETSVRLIVAGPLADPHRERREALRRRERDLFPGDRLYWGLGAYDYITVTPNSFRRGFVEAVALSWEDCAAHLDAILVVQPVTTVTLTTRPHLERVDVTTAGDGPWSRHAARLGGRTALRETFLPRLTPGEDLLLPYLRAEWPRVEVWHLLLLGLPVERGQIVTLPPGARVVPLRH